LHNLVAIKNINLKNQRNDVTISGHIDSKKNFRIIQCKNNDLMLKYNINVSTLSLHQYVE